MIKSSENADVLSQGFGDQGNTTGIHAAMLLIVKPWMGCIAAEDGEK